MYGAVAQLVAHLHGMEGVRGSNPLSSTFRGGFATRTPYGAGVIFGEASVVVTATPDEALALLWDLERYREADHKIGRIISAQPDGGDLVVRFVPKMRGLPGPPVTQRLRRTGAHRIDISDEPGSWVSKVQTFSGFLIAEPTDGGTRVTHREQLDFHGPTARVLERSLRGWLAKDVEAEVVRIGLLLGEHR